MADPAHASDRAALDDPVVGRSGIWVVVLAGGEGIRLRPLTRLYGDERPKQYAPLLGSRSLLRAALDRAARIVPVENIVVLTSAWHAPWTAEEFASGPTPNIVAQPRDRGTAAGVLLPVHWVLRRDPGAVVAVFPSDHFVRDESAFARHVQELTLFARRHPERILLAGARPTGPDPGYGWIEPADAVGDVPSGPIRRVRRFWEKPSGEAARSCFAAGCLWNTFLMVGSACAFAEAGRRYLPRLNGQLARAARFVGTEDERRVLEAALDSVACADFSRAVLEAGPPFLAVSELPPVGWSDWGTPQRVRATLESIGSGAPAPLQSVSSGFRTTLSETPS